MTSENIKLQREIYLEVPVEQQRKNGVPSHWLQNGCAVLLAASQLGEVRRRMADINWNDKTFSYRGWLFFFWQEWDHILGLQKSDRTDRADVNVATDLNCNNNACINEGIQMFGIQNDTVIQPIEQILFKLVQWKNWKEAHSLSMKFIFNWLFS